MWSVLSYPSETAFSPPCSLPVFTLSVSLIFLSYFICPPHTVSSSPLSSHTSVYILINIAPLSLKPDIQICKDMLLPHLNLKGFEIKVKGHSKVEKHPARGQGVNDMHDNPLPPQVSNCQALRRRTSWLLLWIKWWTLAFPLCAPMCTHTHTLTIVFMLKCVCSVQYSWCSNWVSIWYKTDLICNSRSPTWSCLHSCPGILLLKLWVWSPHSWPSPFLPGGHPSVCSSWT